LNAFKDGEVKQKKGCRRVNKFPFRSRSWELQRSRYGHQLSECLAETDRRIIEWNDNLVFLHTITQAAANQVSTLSLGQVIEQNDFDANYPFWINRALRDFLALARPLRDGFEDFVAELAANIQDIIFQLAQCDRQVKTQLFLSTRNLTSG